MKVLFDHQVFSYQEHGGVSRYFIELLKGLSTWNCQVELPLFRTPTVALQQWDSSRFRPWLSGFSFKGKPHLLNAFNQNRVHRYWKKNRPDVFHPTYYQPWFVPFLGETPLVVTVHDMTHERYPETLVDVASTTANKRNLVQRAHKIIAVSQQTATDLVQFLGVEPTRVRVIPHGLSLVPEKIKPTPHEIARPYFLYVGHRHGYKNWSFLIPVLKQLKTKTPDVFMICVGGGAPSTVEKAWIDQNGLQSAILFRSASDEALAGLYSQAIALLYPSLYEGFGLPLIEAMAWGCPVVASKASCLPEIGGEAVLLIDPNNESDWVDGLHELLISPSLRDELQNKGRQRARVFSWEESCRLHAEVYRSL